MNSLAIIINDSHVVVKAVTLDKLIITTPKDFREKHRKINNQFSYPSRDRSFFMRWLWEGGGERLVGFWRQYGKNKTLKEGGWR